MQIHADPEHWLICRMCSIYMKQKFKKITLATKVLTFCFCVIQRYEQGCVQAAL